MAIVAKKKAKGGRGGICAGVSPRIRTGALALVAVLCVGAAVWWLVAGRTRETEPAKQDVEQGAGNRERGTEEKGEECENVKVWKQPTANVEKGERGTGNGEWGTGNGEPQEEEPAPPPEPPARTNHVLSYREGKHAASHIKSEADQIIAFAAQGADYSGGMPPLPVTHWPDGGNAEFLASLTNEIVVLEEDSPEVVRQKEAMIDFRRQIKDIIDAGGTFEQAIAEYQDWVNECANLRLSAIREYQRLKAEDPAYAEEWRLSANEELEAAGATPIPEPGAGRGRRGRRQHEQ